MEAKTLLTVIESRPQVLDALGSALGTYHPGATRHADRVRAVANAIGETLGLPRPELEALNWAAWLHDLGKLGVPAAMLAKKGPLTDAEWVQMKRHPTIGADLILSVSTHLDPIATPVRSHHERWDGAGYPDGLRGEEIQIVARIIATADVFDTITHRRPYATRIYTRDEAADELVVGSGTQFDPMVIEVFRDLHEAGRLPE